MRGVVIILLILTALYIAAAAFYIYSTSTAIASRAGSRSLFPNLSSLPSNLSNITLYLIYSVDGYVVINGSIIDISNANISITASYTERPVINMGGNSTNTSKTTNVTIERYYSVSASGDDALLWALSQLIIMTYNASPNISIAESWNASSIRDIFGNLSLFTRRGEGQLQGSGIAYVEYSLSTGDGVVTIRISKNLGIPLECLVNTKWGDLRLRLVRVSPLG